MNINEVRDNGLQIAGGSRNHRNRRYLSLAFTEHGATDTDLARKLQELEKSVATLDARSRRQFEEVYKSIRALMTPPASKSRPIGFAADLDEDC